jgi:adenylylsulfate kinase-like enzyme
MDGASPNVVWQHGSATPAQRTAALGRAGCTIWMTGLSGSGKSTIALAAERALLAVAEARDPKGLYKRARAGELERFTGVSDPYEVPEAPDLRLATDAATVESCVTSVVALAQRLARPA